MAERDHSVHARNPVAGRALAGLILLGLAQLFLWVMVAGLAGRFAPGSEFAQRPLLLVAVLLAIGFVLYLASLTLVWKVAEAPSVARIQWRIILLFAVLFRLSLLWSHPIQELDLYRYLWDGRVLAGGINPYRYSPAQVDAAHDDANPSPDLQRLTRLLHRSPEVAKIFSLIDHRTVPTIYPPLSEGVFAAIAWITPERAPVRVQVSVLKGVLLLFDLATIFLVAGLLVNLGQPPARALAYAWCPLVLKEFANTGHLDGIAVCLTTATLWLLTQARSAKEQTSSPGRFPSSPTSHDWWASVLWAGAVLAKIYPLVLTPVLLGFWWRRLRWRSSGLVGVFVLVLLGGYLAMPAASRPSHIESITVVKNSSFSGLDEFVRHWEMNDLLFSVVYENIRPHAGHSDHQPWYSVLPANARERLNAGLARLADRVGLNLPATRIAFLFTQALSAGTLFLLACALALRRWPDDPGEELLRRAFLCLAWLWFLSATQNPWYWTWALPLVLFASRPWLLVSGFALIYYLRFWFVHAFIQANLPGGLNGQRFFDEVVVWSEHLPPLLALLLYYFQKRKDGGMDITQTTIHN